MKPDTNANVLTYLQWRGDLSFSQSAFNEIDSLIFCCLSYLNWDGIAEGQTPADAIPLQEAAAIWKKKSKQEQVCRAPSDLALLEAAAESERFQRVRLFFYQEIYSEAQQQQFSAICFLIDSETVYVAFRGTDDSLIGWREDFNMSFLEHVPSQVAASSYLQNVLQMEIPHIFVGGHSKGGNLAVYAAVHIAPDAFPRLEAIYNNDGPGFSGHLLHSAAYAALQSKIHTYVPQASIVGMLLEHEEAYQVVYSNQKGFLQHDPYSWCVVRNTWYLLEEITPASQVLDLSLKKWISGMTPEERERMTDGIFSVLQSETDAKTVRDLKSGGINTLSKILLGWRNASPETRQFMQHMLLELVSTVQDSAKIRKQNGKKSDVVFSAMRRRRS